MPDISNLASMLQCSSERFVQPGCTFAKSTYEPTILPGQRWMLTSVCCVAAVSFACGLIAIVAPSLFMAPLLPADPSLPSFALASGNAALRIAGAFLLAQVCALQPLLCVDPDADAVQNQVLKRGLVASTCQCA